MTGVHIHKGLYTVIGHAMRYGVCCLRQAPQNLYTSPSASLLSSWFCLKPSTESLKVCISQRNRRTHSSLPWITLKDIWHVGNSLKAARITSIIFAQALRLYKVFRVGGQNIRRKHAGRMSTGNNVYVEARACRSQWPRGLRVLACWIVGSNAAGVWIFLSCECCVLSGRGLLWVLCVVR